MLSPTSPDWDPEDSLAMAKREFGEVRVAMMKGHASPGFFFFSSRSVSGTPHLSPQRAPVQPATSPRLSLLW